MTMKIYLNMRKDVRCFCGKKIDITVVVVAFLYECFLFSNVIHVIWMVYCMSSIHFFFQYRISTRKKFYLTTHFKRNVIKKNYLRQ